MTLRDELREAEETVNRLKSAISAADCKTAGHTMVFAGGRNAGCCEDCTCGVPVYECSECGLCDFGDNDEANHIISECPNSELVDAPSAEGWPDDRYRPPKP